MAEQVLEQVEKALLRGEWSSQITETPSAAVDLSKMVVEGRFRDVLTSETVRSVFRLSSDDGIDRPFNELLDMSILPGKDQIEEELTRLAVAVACLHAFVQANWTGPELDATPLEILTGVSDAVTLWNEEVINAKAIAELATGGEPIYHLAKVPAFLRLSQLLVNLPYKHIATISWWRLRVKTVHQQILDEPVAVSEDFHALLEPLLSSMALEPDLAGRMYLELGLLDHLLSRDKTAAEYFVKASRSTGLEYELTGALGRRTKFQVTELSQLVLLAESRLSTTDGGAPHSHEEGPTNTDGEAASSSIGENKNVPETLALNDDTLLEQTQFTSSHPAGPNSHLRHIDPSAQPALHPLDQCILLSLCLNVRNTSPSHGLTAEQMAPYVSRVLSHPRNWSVHTMALLLRSRLESSRTRTVERSTLQLQALIDQMPTSDSSTAERLLYFHEFALPSRWEMEKELAQRYLSLGVVKSALEIFERLEMWEEVVKCYGALERPEKGIAIVRDLLEGRKKEADAVISHGKATSAPRKKVEDMVREAKLWCLLGDLDPANAAEHYTRAWEVSNGTSGRAMRSLGGYHFARGRYRDAVECLQRAVKINPLLTRSWFILGCACMRLEEWEDAKDAFARCVAIDEEDGESWNNLASMYLRIGSDTKKRQEKDGDDDAEEGSPSTEAQENDPSETRDVQPDTSNKGIPFENKMLAFRALKQGLRYSYENWRMWYNYMIVAMDVGELQESCRALGRVVEQTVGVTTGGGGGGGGEGPDASASLAAVDEDVLDRLVDAVTRAPADPDEAVAASAAGSQGVGVASAGEGEVVQNPNEGHGLYKNVRTLFERTLLPRVSSPRVFRAYGRLLSWRGEWDASIKAYMDAYRCGVAAAGGGGGGGEMTAEKWREGVGEVEDVVDVLRNFGPRVEGEGEGGSSSKWKLQARSVVRAFMGRTRDFEDEPEWRRLEEMLEDLKNVRED